ncbi:MAG: uracil phosphoribosyltransferase [Candidatus Tokpelaia sp.]|uniref:uracil phosphoribosyltransferase n=1 Tax=Candidatus Tokpelaia sp. TaxID=2233777 RepID=UPI00123B6D46|nr:uracil phosphoribosyltransferase [Candidatus Tokpelaia sp.]KAA6205501.1 MAG: uracil phosphoribosyltransferase [Candidatus Tokpelaia sp.]KAA6206226.1 MAG: uracil phosphoribosyltransferase [Candidatus Tokpelaia sp.]KAA6406036.1 uracil phosphoribosyltransferase [Candidatus Tokpelaia sp.]
MVKSALHIIKHPLIQHKLTQMRRRETPTAEFRQLLREIALLLGYEVTRDLELENVPVDTPLAHCEAPVLKGKKLVLVSILRAGEGLVQGMLDLIPSARIAHIGLYRDHETLQPVEYYFKAPEDIASRLVIVADPMLATGHSAAAALSKLKERGADNLRFVSLLAAPEGIAYLQKHHANVPLYTAAIDEKLDENGYIVPGLGDAGDRLFGTK